MMGLQDLELSTYRASVASYTVLGVTSVASWAAELNLGYLISMTGILAITAGSVAITLWERLALARDRIILNRERLRRKLDLPPEPR